MILKARTTEELVSEVNKYCKTGWKTEGPLHYWRFAIEGAYFFVQVMIRVDAT
jgi:hypothetical protein